MDPISNADRLVLLLRSKLEERARVAAGGRTTAKPSTGQPDAASGVRALAAMEGGDDRPLRRAVLQNLLADQLGAELVNDAQFQQLVSRVSDAIEEDAAAAALLSRVISELRHS